VFLVLEHARPEIRPYLGVFLQAVEIVACEFLHRRHPVIEMEFPGRSGVPAAIRFRPNRAGDGAPAIVS
jgi:hypothetical protein